MVDLSAATQPRRRAFNPVMTDLRNLGIKHQWGYPTKLLITKGEETVTVHTPEEGTTLLNEWGLRTKRPSSAAPSPHRSTPPGTAQAHGLRRNAAPT
ncbi:Hypothetical predicted protein [Pelobates cultripes]|uniref:Uncharacterized protein n=1 Tax=Pelobates cultripes TaxID=61616 RepID=A0AAD1W9H9_PELCU|nr:Hypothetical predicted protein [Pelobates cultripes]